MIIAYNNVTGRKCKQVVIPLKQIRRARLVFLLIKGATKMKKLLIIAALLTAPVYAQNTNTCKEIEALANTVMSARQNGVQMMQMIEVAGDVKAIKTMIIQAYEVPLYNMDKNKVAAIREFTNEWVLACVKMEL
jgi:hypothetical protein